LKTKEKLPVVGDEPETANAEAVAPHSGVSPRPEITAETVQDWCRQVQPRWPLAGAHAEDVARVFQAFNFPISTDSRERAPTPIADALRVLAAAIGPARRRWAHVMNDYPGAPRQNAVEAVDLLNTLQGLFRVEDPEAIAQRVFGEPPQKRAADSHDTLTYRDNVLLHMASVLAVRWRLRDGAPHGIRHDSPLIGVIHRARRHAGDKTGAGGLTTYAISQVIRRHPAIWQARRESYAHPRQYRASEVSRSAGS
jgi:hypothetical protein